jgi:hypothetical protein
MIEHDVGLRVASGHHAGHRTPYVALRGVGFSSLLALALVLACGPVRLVSPYDEIIDRTTSELHTRIVSFVGRMVTLSGKPEGTYESNANFYDDVRGSISTIRLRARVQEKNEITLNLIQELEGNIERLRLLHELGKERGLTKPVADPALHLIEVNCEGIIKFEVAKRRGETGRSN